VSVNLRAADEPIGPISPPVGVKSGPQGDKINKTRLAHWDPDAERLTNLDEANQMLSRPRRKGCEPPQLT
jgi:hypothetical protein